MKKFALRSFVASFLFGISIVGVCHAAPTAPATSSSTAPDTSGALLRWQTALDQLTLGNTVVARTLLEQARARGGDSPEINLILAYLAERDGKSAQEFLAPIKAQSKMAASWKPAAPRIADITVATTTTAVLPATNPAVVVTQTDARLAALEAYMVNRVNAERRALNLRPLTTDSLLADTARGHSTEMRDKKYFAHESPTPSLAAPIDRYRAAFGRTPNLVAENIYRSWGGQRKLSEKDMEEAHVALMKSPGHHANIILPDAARIGIGISINANGDLWVTQMFARG
jgi:uncharacterized protein YkwD